MASLSTATERTLEPLERLRAAAATLDLTLETSITGYSVLADRDSQLGSPEWQQLTRRYPGEWLNFIHLDFVLEHAGVQARRGFPELYASSVIGLASVLEVGLHDFVRAWLRDHAAASRSDGVAQIAVPLAVFSGMNRTARAGYLLEQLVSRLRSSSSGQRARPGVEVYLRLLAAVGLHPVLTEATVASVNELVAIRNQFVHHAGRVTPRFTELCPRFAAPRPRRIRVTHEMWSAYLLGVTDFAEGLYVCAASLAGLNSD